MRRPLLAALLLLLAGAALGASLLHYARNHIVTHIDGTETRTLAGEPVVTTYWEVMDFVCVEGFACRDKASAVVQGLYPRAGVPVLAAILGGLALPLLLVVAAVVIAARRRWVTVLCLCAAGLILSWCLTGNRGDYIETHFDGRVTPATATAPIYLTRVDAGTDPCLDPNPCRKGTYAFRAGLFPERGVPWLLAVTAGIALPLLLFAAALALGLRGRLSSRR